MAEDSQLALEQERQTNTQAALSASKHAELVRKVETLSAITDSNRLLREKKTHLESIVSEAQEAGKEDKLYLYE